MFDGSWELFFDSNACLPVLWAPWVGTKLIEIYHNSDVTENEKWNPPTKSSLINMSVIFYGIYIFLLDITHITRDYCKIQNCNNDIINNGL